MFNPEKIRKDFPVLSRKIWDDKPLIYFDNAATTQKPKQVIDALVNYYENYNANIHRGVHKLAEEATCAYENVREKVKHFVGACDDDYVVFTRNTTESINLLAYSLGELLNPGDEILLSEMEHHSNLIPWYILKDRKHIKIKFLPITKSYELLNSGDEILLTEMEHHSNLIPWYILKDRKHIKIKFLPITKTYELDYSLLEKYITKRTKIISVSHKSNVLGTTNDVKKISQIAKLNNSILIVDAAQSVPHLPVNFNELGCDFFVFSSHKMCGPTGVGVIVGKKEIFQKLPPFLGGGEMIKKVTFDSFTTNDLPWRFEAGTPNIADVIAFGIAIDYLIKIDIRDIFSYEVELTKYALEKLRSFDFLTIYGPDDVTKRAGIITFSNPVVHPHDIATIVDQYGVAVRAGHHCAQPLMQKLNVSATTRASFYFYNTKEEVDIFIDALKKAFDYFAIGACKELKGKVGERASVVTVR